MTQEDKELLLKDLCARLPYGIKVLADIDKTFDGGLIGIINMIQPYVGDKYPKLKGQYLLYLNGCLTPLTIDEVKPYLFPLSSITEEQKEEFDRIYADDMQVVANNLKNRLDGKPYETNLGHYRHIDWLNANHFDYRGLIPKGLAIDATGLNIY